MPILDLDLTLEQEFLLAKLKTETEQASSNQLKELLLEITRQLLIKDNIVKQLIKDRL
jgi:Phycobilisome degradation protein nblA